MNNDFTFVRLNVSIAIPFYYSKFKTTSFKSIERKSSALMPPSSTINADCGWNSLQNLSNPFVHFSALLFNPMATTEPFLRRTKFTSYLYILLSGLSILAQCKGNKYIQVSINALCMNEDISQNS